MVEIPFGKYSTLAECPLWWQNFVENIFTGRQYDANLLTQRLAFFGGSFIYRPHDTLGENIETLFFETEEKFTTFAVFWMLYGK
jgi:hypothetical protein